METQPSTKRVGFIVASGPPAREDSQILHDGQVVGKVTSGTFSPSLKKPLGMAYVSPKVSRLGTKLKVSVRNNEYDLVISKMPFVPHKYYKKKVVE